MRARNKLERRGHSKRSNSGKWRPRWREGLRDGRHRAEQVGCLLYRPQPWTERQQNKAGTGEGRKVLSLGLAVASEYACS